MVNASHRSLVQILDVLFLRCPGPGTRLAIGSNERSNSRMLSRHPRTRWQGTESGGGGEVGLGPLNGGSPPLHPAKKKNHGGVDKKPENRAFAHFLENWQKI